MSAAQPQLPVERRGRGGLILPLSLVGAVALAVIVWLVVTGSRSKTGTLVFESPSLGCRFEYPAELTAGPNFVRNPAGSFLTLERHSLLHARKDFVAGLPDALYPQVQIQLDQGYRDLEELSRTRVQIGGRPALEVILKGKAGKSSLVTIITVDIVATDEWVYVLRSYSPDERYAVERPVFDQVRRTLTFEPRPGGPSSP